MQLQQQQQDQLTVPQAHSTHRWLPRADAPGGSRVDCDAMSCVLSCSKPQLDSVFKGVEENRGAGVVGPLPEYVPALTPPLVSDTREGIGGESGLVSPTDPSVQDPSAAGLGGGERVPSPVSSFADFVVKRHAHAQSCSSDLGDLPVPDAVVDGYLNLCGLNADEPPLQDTGMGAGPDHHASNVFEAG